MFVNMIWKTLYLLREIWFQIQMFDLAKIYLVMNSFLKEISQQFKQQKWKDVVRALGGSFDLKPEDDGNKNHTKMLLYHKK